MAKKNNTQAVDTAPAQEPEINGFAWTPGILASTTAARW